MTLLLDGNLSLRLVALLGDLYPESTQVELLGYRGATDTMLWELSTSQGYVLVSKDDDCRQRSFSFGAPPKVIWLNVGNARTSHIDTLPRVRG